MSMIKRKASSLDPLQKQKKNRQTEYYALIDKCLQIPSDDKLLLRKNVQEEEERLISLLQKYRKQGGKDLKDLQIYLRKYIQKYKQQNPKYPTYRFGKSTQSGFNFQKRNSLSFSVNTSKLTLDIGNGHSQVKRSLQIPPSTSSSTDLNSPHFRQQKSSQLPIQPSFRFDHTKSVQYGVKQEEKNYQELIRKRKTEKLKISKHRVSVTIQNQSHSASFYNEVSQKQQKTHMRMASGKQKEKQIGFKENVEYKAFKKQDNVLIVGDVQKIDFLQTMRFRMKIDEDQEQNIKIEEEKENSQPPCLFQPQNIGLPIMTTNQSVYQTISQSQVLNPLQQNLQLFSDIKRKLFLSNESLKSSKISQKQTFIKQQIGLRSPLEQVNFESTFNQIKNSLNRNKPHNSLIQQKQSLLNSFDGFGKKEKFNSGKNSQDSILRQLFSNSKHQQKYSLNGSVVRKDTTDSRFHVNSLSTIMNKENSLIENIPQTQSQYLKSQRRTSDIYSHRLLQQNKSFLNSFSKDKDEKDSKNSGRMIFSNRMQEVISGRKNNDRENQHDLCEKSPSSFISPSYSFREKQKGASKLQFWARIQSTINS